MAEEIKQKVRKKIAKRFSSSIEGDTIELFKSKYQGESAARAIKESIQPLVQESQTQRLIGEFVETLAVGMHAAEETKRAELQKASPPMTITNVYRRKAKRDAVTKDEREILTHLHVRLEPYDTDKEQQGVEQMEINNET
ncbi:hypothetical protein KI688_000936 [Linnemannia hyalina]|uniref:Uncharacterized protein n=1 Tax=Linnemannia hyalina TaxID=64524 RepID=A0A9P8BXY9_9FUNG|nr:hypothetical protein KI688_000936 [Linnemannia hyalina]